MNLIKAYSLIFDTCSIGMQSWVMEHPDYENKIKNDPIELLKAIKILMHDPVRARYALTSLTDTVERLMNLKQQDNKHLLDYTRCFKQARDILKASVGNDILDKFISDTKAYKAADATEQVNMKKEAFEKWMGYLYIKIRINKNTAAFYKV